MTFNNFIYDNWWVSEDMALLGMRTFLANEANKWQILCSFEFEQTVSYLCFITDLARSEQ